MSEKKIGVGERRIVAGGLTLFLWVMFVAPGMFMAAFWSGRLRLPWPDLPNWSFQEIGAFAGWLAALYGVPIAAACLIWSGLRAKKRQQLP